jgi:glutaredoxin
MISADRPPVRVFGASWCEDTSRTRRLLRRLRVPFEYRDVDLDLDALREALALHSGPRRTPIVSVGDRVLAEPDSATLIGALVRTGALAASDALARIKDHNVGDLDRTLRLIAAAVAVASTAGAPRVVRWPIRVGAALLALTAARAWCPVYDAWQVTSMNGPGDRPDAAERRTWLASTSHHTPAWSEQ